MNDNELNFQKNDNVYQATTNLNTAIENPNVDIDSATNINIENNLNSMIYSNNLNTVEDNNYNTNVVDMNNNFNSNVVSNDALEQSSNQNLFVNNGNFNVENNQSNIDFGTDIIIQNNKTSNKVSYQPTIKKKNKPSSGLVVPNEVKAMVVIIVILLMALFVIPYVYDIVKGLSLGGIFR